MCVGLPSVGLQWIILLRRGTSCSPCRHKAWHCHSNNPPPPTPPKPPACSSDSCPLPKRERGTGQQSERGRREVLNGWECAKTQNEDAERRERQMEVKDSLCWNDRRWREEGKRERLILLGLSFTVLVPLTQQIIFTSDTWEEQRP